MTRAGWSDRAESALTVVLASLFVGSVLVGLSRSNVPRMLEVAEERGAGIAPLVVSLLAVVLALWLALAEYAGPLALEPCELQWRVMPDQPERRLRRLLLRTLAAHVGIALVVAGTLGLSLATSDLTVAWAAALLAALVGASGLAARLQRLDRPLLVRSLAWGAVIGGCAAGVWAAWSWQAAPVGALVGLAAAAPGGAAAGLRRLPPGHAQQPPPALVPRWQLTRAARNRWSVVTGVTLLDASVVGTVHRAGQRAELHPLPEMIFRAAWPLRCSIALLLRGLGGVLALIVLAVPAAVAVQQLFGTSTALGLVVLSELVLTVRLSRGVTAWTSAPSLARTWAPVGRRAPVGLAMPPVVGGGLLGLTAGVALSAAPVAVGLLVVLPSVILLRRWRAARGSAGLVLVTTPMGPVPLQTANRVVAGIDVALVAALLLTYPLS